MPTFVSISNSVDSSHHCYLGGGHYGGGVISLQLVDKACGPAGLISVVGGRISWLKAVCFHFHVNEDGMLVNNICLEASKP